MDIKLTIPGAPVTKKNSQRIIRLGNGRPMIRPSKRFEEYQEEAGLYIPAALRVQLDRPVNLRALYYMPTRRRVDLVNLLEATCDILVHYGVLKDDHCGIVAGHDGSRVLYDRERPRAEVYIVDTEEI